MFRNRAPDIRAQLETFPWIPHKVQERHLTNGCLLSPIQIKATRDWFAANPEQTRGLKFEVEGGKKVYTLRLVHPVTKAADFYVSYLGKEHGLGDGGFSTLRYLQSLTTLQWFAVKKTRFMLPGSWLYLFYSLIMNVSTRRELVFAEIENLNNIGKLLGFSHSVSKNGYESKYLIGMPLAQGKTLFDLVTSAGAKLTPDRWLILMEKVAKAGEDFLNAGFIHDDLKLENVIIGDEAELVDFQVIGKTPSHTNVNFGAPLMRAHELETMGATANYSEATSVYSLGAMFQYALNPDFYDGQDVLCSASLRTAVNFLLESVMADDPLQRASFSEFRKSVRLLGLSQPTILNRIQRVGLIDLDEFLRLTEAEKNTFVNDFPTLDVLYFVDQTGAHRKKYIALRKWFESADAAFCIANQVITAKTSAESIVNVLRSVPQLLNPSAKERCAYFFCTNQVWAGAYMDGMLANEGVLVLTVKSITANMQINRFLVQHHLTALQYELAIAKLADLQQTSPESMLQALRETQDKLEKAPKSLENLRSALVELEKVCPTVQVLIELLDAQDKQYGGASVPRLGLI